MKTQLEVTVYELMQAASNDDIHECTKALSRIASVMSSQFGHLDTGLAFRKALDHVLHELTGDEHLILEIENSGRFLNINNTNIQAENIHLNQESDH